MKLFPFEEIPSILYHHKWGSLWIFGAAVDAHPSFNFRLFLQVLVFVKSLSGSLLSKLCTSDNDLGLVCNVLKLFSPSCYTKMNDDFLYILIHISLK